MPLKSYRELEVWNKALALVKLIYQATKDFPSDERFGLTNQLRRAAVSIPANIAEGYGRLHRGDYVRHLSIANGSLMETESLLIISLELNYLKQEQNAIFTLVDEISRMLRSMIGKLNVN